MTQPRMQNRSQFGGLDKHLATLLEPSILFGLRKSQAADVPPSVLVIDDADLGFRTYHGRVAWPLGVDAHQEPQPDWIILKMSNPLAQGDLWRALLNHSNDPQSEARQNLILDRKSTRLN